METLAFIHHIFLPRHTNNFRAKILHNHVLLSFAMILVIANSVLGILSSPKVAVLGYAASISPQRVIELTNQKRAEAGVGSLTLNDSLSKAAKEKGLDMIQDNYWAHVAPDGTEPWDFFKAVGYSYRFAGENLARDFTNPEDAIDAWMASPSHRENMLSEKYTEIGVAVVEGDLNGKDTTLIVQLFGTPSSAVPAVPVAAANSGGESLAAKDTVPPAAEVKEIIPVPTPLQVEQKSPVVSANNFDVMKVITISVIFVIAFVLIFDVIYISRRNVTRVGGRAFAHLSFMIMVLVILIIIRSGEIL